MEVIDFHCHVGPGRHYTQSPEVLLERMAEAGIARAVICPADRFLAVDNREGNDYLLRAVQLYPDKLLGFATANPWYGQRAIDELRRALGEGLVGIKFHPPLQGFLLADELINPLIEIAAVREIPVYFHTGTPVNALPLQLSVLARRFPTVNFIMGHMGCTDFWMDVIPAASSCPNIFLETSHDYVSSIQRAVMAVGAGRVLFGSDAPFNRPELELRKIMALDVDEETRIAICSGNARHLLKLSASR